MIESAATHANVTVVAARHVSRHKSLDRGSYTIWVTAAELPACHKPTRKSRNRFTPYQTFVVASLAFLQFAVILDFMIVAPLGALVMPALDMSPRNFGIIVSAYAFSAGASGLLVAGFADRNDRKKLLLFFYTGFVLGTLWCGLANSFHALLAARTVTGIFGGVIGSVVMAIATDLFEPDQRGRVMGFIPPRAVALPYRARVA